MNLDRPMGGPLKLAAILLTLFGGFIVCAGLGVLAEVPLTILFGWPWYLKRVIPQLNPDPAAVLSAAVYLCGVTVGGHAFLRWVYAASSAEPRRWPWRWTLQLVALVVLMFVAGIAVTGLAHQTGWLIRSPEPLIQGGRYDGSARAYSQSNLKQIAYAVHSFDDNQKPPHLTRSTFDATGRPLHSWQTFLLPYIEQGSLYSQIDRSKPWTHPDNATPMATLVKVFWNPSAPTERTINGFGVSHYAANVHVVLTDTPKTMKSFPLGLSNTILAGEVASNFRAWGDPLNARDPKLGSNAHPDGFGSPSNRPVQFAMLDGSVRTFNAKELADLMDGKVPE